MLLLGIGSDDDLPQVVHLNDYVTRLLQCESKRIALNRAFKVKGVGTDIEGFDGIGGREGDADWAIYGEVAIIIILRAPEHWYSDSIGGQFKLLGGRVTGWLRC